MSEYERGYKQGLEDGHRCEMNRVALEADNAALRLKVQEYNSALDAMTARYVVLEALVTALPVLDMRFDSVVTVHGGWVVGGAMFGKRVEADTYAALLTHRQGMGG